LRKPGDTVSGRLEILATPLLRRISVDWVAKYVDETSIRSLYDHGGPVTDDAIALRPIRGSGQLFVVGTRDDEQKIEEIVYPTHVEGNSRISIFDNDAYEGLKLGSAP
jgi:hypothetical protein